MITASYTKNQRKKHQRAVERAMPFVQGLVEQRGERVISACLKRIRRQRLEVNARIRAQAITDAMGQ